MTSDSFCFSPIPAETLRGTARPRRGAAARREWGESRLRLLRRRDPHPPADVGLGGPRAPFPAPPGDSQATADVRRPRGCAGAQGRAPGALPRKTAPRNENGGERAATGGVILTRTGSDSRTAIESAALETGRKRGRALFRKCTAQWTPRAQAWPRCCEAPARLGRTPQSQAGVRRRSPSLRRGTRPGRPSRKRPGVSPRPATSGPGL